eukprot:5856854-Amphidinium_carterae.1
MASNVGSAQRDEPTRMNTCICQTTLVGCEHHRMIHRMVLLRSPNARRLSSGMPMRMILAAALCMGHLKSSRPPKITHYRTICVRFSQFFWSSCTSEEPQISYLLFFLLKTAV